jgi:hypothetical protein
MSRSLRTKLPSGVAGALTGPSKYRAVPTVYNGVRYASKAEAERAKALDGMVAAGRIREFVRQPVFRLGCPENVYRADFLVIDDDEAWVEDVKGHETAKFKRDVKLWRAYGRLDLYIIKKGKVSKIIEGGGRDHDS